MRSIVGISGGEIDAKTVAEDMIGDRNRGMGSGPGFLAVGLID
jgi:hypothetical protein